MLKKIDTIVSSQKVNMGGVILDQPLPTQGLDRIDPFLLIHHWSDKLKGGQKQNDVGVGPHPHRGFSPVTFIFKGSVHHRDSIGNDEIVRAGGTQWMNSGSGLVHSERPGADLAEKGGDFEIIQFWVNSPASMKMKEASYQPLTKEDTPWVELDEGKVKVGVVSGEFQQEKSPIQSDSPLLVLRMEFKAGGQCTVPVTGSYNTILYSLGGELEINREKSIGSKDMVKFKREEGDIHIKANNDCDVILLAGEPINESVATYGPFVMNSQSEIIQALNDFQDGKMGQLKEEFA